jgi:hypothetical protein
VAGIADPRPPRRIKDASAGRDKLRGERLCRVCKQLGRETPATNRMHVVPRSLGGDDVDDNLVPGCGSGTTGCHGVLTSRNADGATGLTFEEAAAALVESLRADERAYAASSKYPGWIEDYYLAGAA